MGEGDSGCLVLLDIAGFAYVNQDLGYQAGDRFLLACWQAFCLAFPEGTAVARTSGDRFAALAPGAGLLDGPALAVSAIESVVAAMDELNAGRWIPDARCGWAVGTGPVGALLQAATEDLNGRDAVERASRGSGGTR